MEIETKRLILREFTLDDWPDVLAYQSDRCYQRFYPFTERTSEDAQAFVQMFIDDQHARPRTKFQLAVTHKGDPRLNGNSGICLDAPEARQASIGYQLPHCKRY